MIAVVVLLTLLNLMTAGTFIENGQYPILSFCAIAYRYFCTQCATVFQWRLTNRLFHLVSVAITIAAATLPWRYAWALSAITIGYTINNT